MISIIASIQPKWCELIASGEKTIEVRKTAPKEVPFKVFMYCTKVKDRKKYTDEFDVPMETRKWMGNGKVIGEFVCDKVSLEIPAYKDGIRGYWGYCDLINGSCLTLDELDTYGKNRMLFSWHISDLKIYDKPKELSEFGLKRPPQSWQYCEELRK